MKAESLMLGFRLRFLRWLAWVVFIAVAYGPLAGAISGSQDDPLTSLAAVVSPRRLALLLDSLTFSLSIALLTTLTGVLAALPILRHCPRGARRLQWLLLASVALPPTVFALAWSRFFSLISSIVGIGMIGNWWLAGLAQALALLPFSTGIALAALATTDQRLIDAARVLVSPARLLFTIAVPLARPMLLSGAALVFLLSLLDYTIPSIFGANVYSLEIFVTFSATHRVADAFWLSLPLVACALALVSILSELPQRLAQTASTTFPSEGSLPVLAQSALLIATALAGIATLAPLWAFVPALGDPAYLGRTIAASGREAGFTFFTSTIAAVLALILSIIPAIDLARCRRSAPLLWATCLLPFLIPPALTGIGVIALWSPVRVLDIYGTDWMTIIAELARFTPVAIIVLSTSLLRLDPVLIDAALVGGSSLRAIVRKVLLPLALPGLTAATGICFVLSLGEIGANLLVTPAGSATLTMKSYNYLHYGGSQAAAGLNLMLLALAALGAALPLWALNRRSS